MLRDFMHQGLIEAGCDEAGRGCLCGPVACAAVILPPDFVCEELNDSKQLSEKKRDALRPLIEEKALDWSVVMVSPQEIDEINILNASIVGMHRALANLKIRPEHILVDGNRFRPFENIPHTMVVKGDATFMSIAAASILAKTHRDELMLKLAKEFPNYAWEVNKGYPTKAHRRAISELGPTPHHRKTFKLLPS
ncbi:MAG: ribonuclease HII [Muribaculaceae bacterium]|nr:ribonuclease HII [Muribaculaceae bacterium]